MNSEIFPEYNLILYEKFLTVFLLDGEKEKKYHAEM